jgi:CHAD domain-containing protein
VRLNGTGGVIGNPISLEVHPKAMALDPKPVQKPFRKLGKLLKKLSDPPAPNDVHSVRTQTRRIEAMIGAFQLDKKKICNDLVRKLKPIRQVAGVVRDMDVLTGFAASLEAGGDEDCRLQLIEHLAARRKKAAVKMSKRVSANEKTVRRLLQACRKSAVDDIYAATFQKTKRKDIQKSRHKSATSMATSLQIEQERRSWPTLSGKNIHPFRIKVKELRYVLQMGQNSDSKFIAALGDVKDQLGLWHDWNELAAISSKVLGHRGRCPIAAQIGSRTKEELKKGLKSAYALRSQYLPRLSGRSRWRKGVYGEIHPELVKATSRLAS